MVNTPVLFETFVRVDYARQVWDAIKAAQPKKLYFYSNKGRAEKKCEIERNNEIRSWVKEIDWDCELHTWFREECVDVYTSLKGAVDWVCEHEEAWIVLEDDVVPTPAFFSFCDQMIDYYRDDMRVWNVSGDNFLNINPGGYDYIFSHYHWMYGWATWRNRWLAIKWDDFKIDETIEKGVFRSFFKTNRQVKQAEGAIRQVKDFLDKTNCWDFAFGLTCDQHGAMEVVPSRHLITNLGILGEHHAKAEKNIFNIESDYKELKYKISKHPPFVIPDKEYDYYTFKNIYINNRPLWKRIIISAMKILHIEKSFRKLQIKIKSY